MIFFQTFIHETFTNASPHCSDVSRAASVGLRVQAGRAEREGHHKDFPGRDGIVFFSFCFKRKR